MNGWRKYTAAAVLAAVGLLCGCGGGGSSKPLIAVSISPIVAQSVDEGQIMNLTALVANDTSNKGVTWTATCGAAACGKFTGQTPMSTTYTAPNPVTSSLSVTIVATSAADTSKSASSTISVVPPPSVATTSLPGGIGGVAYNSALQESGGIAPFTWSITSGSLPDGIGLSTNTISGSPIRGGTFNFTVQVADSGTPALTASANLSITVTVLPLSINTLSLPNAIVDTAYKQPVQVTGGIPPYTWSVTGGTLPSWSSLGSSTGTINGMPGDAGKSDFTVMVADSAADGSVTAIQPLSITTVTAASMNASELNGHYAFLFQGFDDASGSQVAIAGSFTADGKGNITDGVLDENGPSGPVLNAPFGGTYNIGSDNRGGITTNETAGSSRTYAIIVDGISGGISQNGHLVEFDDTNGTTGRRGSGVLRRQDTTAFSKDKIAGPYAFGFTGYDSAGNRAALVGSFIADGAGTVPSGIADQNIAGTASNPSLTGSYTAPSATNGRASMSIVPSGLSALDLSVYVVSASELLAISIDTPSSNGLTGGTVLEQASSSFDNSGLQGPAVYYTSSNGFAEVGLLASDGRGGVSVTYDHQSGGALAQDQTFTTTYSVPASGRVAINNWYGDSSSSPHILYLLDRNKGFFLDTSTAVVFGWVEPQATAPAGGFSTASLSGSLSAGTIAPSAVNDTTGIGLVTLDGGGAFSESTDLSTSVGLFVDQTTSGTYVIDTSGRGVVTGLQVITAGISISLLTLALAVTALVARKKPVRKLKSGLAMSCVAIWIATIPAGCPRKPRIHQLVFYLVSSQKAVLLEQDTYSVPLISIIEK